ncbi:DNA repair protein RadC [Conchiformibius steedae DSM 2580]|uniref:DNA repair protein RadC n=1 Tax=Conchiformibius steedae DSM 2580 TaxID=1121352 RepID=A0AAE9KZV0_9NEIS|nr:DNA repair protein RadC [Conchiformibius steedae]QMT32648.1 DNA repair protein RadC [Conchiformibius steedae]URD67255.1 DNA repair protein RadC [Conchiformibius steedae DSM 2580]
MSIKHWNENERPREKLLERGAEALSDAELLAILLRVGTQGMSAVDLARSLIQQFGSLRGVMSAPYPQLSQHKGMGLASFAQFSAVREIGKRILGEQLRQTPVFDHPDTVGDYLRLRLGHEAVEVALVLLLDAQNRLLACREMARGSVSESTVYSGEIAKYALHHHAAAVIFAHNHPSGNPQASPADHAFTRKLQAGLALLDIALLDHFIVTAGQTVSFVQQGWLKPDASSANTHSG